MNTSTVPSSSDSSLPPGDALIDRLLGLIYDGTSTASGFQGFIEELTSTYQLKAAMLITRNTLTHEMRGLWMHGIENIWTERYAIEYGQDDPLARHLGSAPIANFYASNLDVSDGPHFTQTRFYQEWLAPQGVAHAAGAIILQEGAWLTQIFLQRSDAQGPFTSADTTLFNRLVPHMQRAIQIRQRIAELEQAHASLTVGLDLLPMATLLFDEHGRVTHQNHRALALFASTDMLRIEHGQLYARNQTLSRRLHFEIGTAIQASRGVATPLNDVLLLPRNDHQPLMLMSAPMKSRQGHGGAMLFVFDPEITPSLTTSRVRQLFGLSEAEASLAVALCSGQTLDEFASTRGVSLNTAKTQLKNTFLKTGAKRQAELVSLLLASPAYFLIDPSDL